VFNERGGVYEFDDNIMISSEVCLEVLQVFLNKHLNIIDSTQLVQLLEDHLVVIDSLSWVCIDSVAAALVEK